MKVPRNGACAQIAAFAAQFDPARLDAAADTAIRRAWIDTLAVTLAGRADPASRRLLEYVRGRQGPRMALSWCDGAQLEEESAALLNGSLAHVLDYDDVSLAMRGHPSVVFFPALLALAENEDCSVADVTAAYAVAMQVAAALGRAAVDTQYARGWHSSATIGMLGAAAGCARLLRLDASAIAHAVGIAVSHVAGTQENFGTMSKALQTGHAASVAVRCARLAALGFTASPSAIDGSRGYTALYGADADFGARLVESLAGPLEVSEGLEIKKYPMCYAAHRTLQGVLDLRSAHALALADVERVEVVTSHQALLPLLHARPQTGLEAKFSLQYGVAAALLDGQVGLASFTDAAVQRPEAQAFLPQVVAREATGTTLPRWAELALWLKAGPVLSLRVEQLRGSGSAPLTSEELGVKTAVCLRHGASAVTADALMQILRLPGATPVRQTLAPLAAASASG